MDNDSLPSTRPANTNAAQRPHVAAAATIDELLASEARANLQRTRAANRNDPVKAKPRISVPPARIIARSVQSPAWKTPFTSLVVIVGLSTLISAGSTAYVLLRPEMTSGVSQADLRRVSDSVAQLRRQVADISATRKPPEATQTISADRTASLARSQPSEQIANPTRNIESSSSQQAASTAASEITGTVPAATTTTAASQEALTGWTVRRAYEGVAILEGKSGVIEVVQGQNVPNLGRILDIKRANDRWQVLTSKGVIVSGR